MNSAALVTGPFSYFETLEPFRAADASAFGTGLSGQVLGGIHKRRHARAATIAEDIAFGYEQWLALLAFETKSLGSPRLFSGSPQASRRQPVPAKELGKVLRVFQAQSRTPQSRCHRGAGNTRAASPIGPNSAKYHLTVLLAADLIALTVPCCGAWFLFQHLRLEDDDRRRDRPRYRQREGGGNRGRSPSLTETYSLQYRPSNDGFRIESR
jgi:hypothetical protein